jgi:hypothetical protein
MKRQAESLKEVASRLAELLASHDGAAVLRQVRRLSHGAASLEPAQAAGRRPLPRAIGIWEPTVKTGRTHFVRTRATGEPASLWANVGTIPPKGARRRIVLLGESVARGMFLDPHFSPALVLRTLLQAGATRDAYEVIDLARSDLLLEPLQDLADAALQLEPDAMVVFAGNNWRPLATPSRTGDYQEMASILRRQGSWADVKRFLEQLLRTQVERGIERLWEIARSRDIPFIFILPEFNLRDWRSDAPGSPLVDPSTMAAWQRQRREAEHALAEGDLARVRQIGAALVALDGGCTPVGATLVADAHIRAGAFCEARRWLERARDASICWPRPESPRCYSVIQETIRDVAVRQGLLLVDLPRVFQEHWPDGVPDRRMFLDYCHLNVEATHVAMRAAATLLLAQWNGAAAGRAVDLTNVRVPVEPKVESEAHFLAAIHNANWGQAAEIVRHHCDRALALSPDLESTMALFLDFHIRRLPSVLCKTFDDLCRRQSLSAISLLFAPALPIPEQFLNVTLIDAMVGSLHEIRPEHQPRVERLLTQEHAVDGRPLDLLRDTYAVDSFLVPFARKRFGYHRAGAPVSSFRFVRADAVAAPDGGDLRLTMTCRCRHASTDQPVTVTVAVNGVRVCAELSARRWSMLTVDLPSVLLRPGINSLEIHWPLPALDLDAWRASVIEQIEDGQYVDLDPPWGEIHQLSMAACATAAVGAGALHRDRAPI